MRRHSIAIAGLVALGTIAQACREAPPSPSAPNSPNYSNGEVASPTRPVGLRSRRFSPPARAVPESYFGMHMHYLVDRSTGKDMNPWPKVGFASWRLWDSGTSWLWLQPRATEWRFRALDSIVVRAERRGVGLILTLGAPPTWASSRPTETSPYSPGSAAPPTDAALWRAYVDTVTKRYRGRIAGYEIWNEPDVRSFWSGSVDEMVTLGRIATEVVHKNDPAALLLSPSPAKEFYGARWLDQYFSGAGTEGVDVVSFHFYVQAKAPEAMMPVLDSVRAVMAKHGITKPLWNTELGWFVQSQEPVTPLGAPTELQGRVLSEDESVAYVSRALILGWCGGMERFYWYAYDNKNMGMTEADRRTPKAIARAYETTRSWLTGSTVLSCVRAEPGVWQVQLRTARGVRRAIFWHEDGAQIDSDVFGSEDWCIISDARGRRHDDEQLTVGSAPVLTRRCSASPPRPR